MIERLLNNLVAAAYKHAAAEVEQALTIAERRVLKMQVVDARQRIADHVKNLKNPPMSFSDVMASHKKEFE